VPSQTETALFQRLYNYLTPDIPLTTPALSPVSYDDFIGTNPVLVSKDAFGEYQIYYRLGYPDNQGGCGKPVIYLYPTQKTTVSVRFGPSVTLSNSLPSYHQGWSVIANPDGTLINLADQKTYPYLYWDGVTAQSFPPVTKGYVVAKNLLHTFLTEQLEEYGLNNTERNDFLAYWLSKMQQYPYYLIHFYTTPDLEAVIPEYIQPGPKTVFRILMWYSPLPGPVSIAPQKTPVPFKRTGFTVVEWGGTAY
ncbi:MAG: hypothetical protein ABSH12_10015, partial [Endomicrobiales bacterium]